VTLKTPSGAGIDTMKLTFGGRRWRRAPTLGGFSGDGGVTWDATNLEGGGRLSMTHRGNASVEASLPSRVRGHNGEPLEVADMAAAIDDLMTEVQTYLRLQPGNLCVARLDLPRDFYGVSDISSQLRGFAFDFLGNRLPGRSLYMKGGIETLAVTIKSSYLLRLYDKSLEARGAVEPGRLRYEPQIRRAKLTSVWSEQRDCTIRTVEDVSQRKVNDLSRALFHEAGFDLAVLTRDAAVRRVLQDPNVKKGTEEMTLLGYLLLQAAGAPVRASRNTMNKYEELAQMLGIRLGSRKLSRPLRQILVRRSV